METTPFRRFASIYGRPCGKRLSVGSPADAAKLAPGEKIMAVNGLVYSGDAIKDAVRATKTGGPMNLIVENDTHVRTVAIDYHDGERYPHLERIDGTPDYLDEIAKPLTPPPSTEKEKTTGGQ
jgi:predicted metalloprotease with PDZ domain